MEDGSDKEEVRDCLRGTWIAGSRKQSSSSRVDRSTEDSAGFDLSSSVILEGPIGSPACEIAISLSSQRDELSRRARALLRARASFDLDEVFQGSALCSLSSHSSFSSIRFATPCKRRKSSRLRPIRRPRAATRSARRVNSFGDGKSSRRLLRSDSELSLESLESDARSSDVVVII